MVTQIKLQNTNYSVSTSNDTLKLDGTFSMRDSRIENYYVNIHTIAGILVGNANYGEYESGNVNYNYNIPAEYKVDVIALVDTSIADIKSELSK